MAIDWDAVVLSPLIEQVYGEPIVYAASGGTTTYPLTGVYDEQFFPLDPSTGMRMTSSTPVVGVRQVAFVQLGLRIPRQDDQITIPANTKLGRPEKRYLVREVQPDSHGHLLLTLNLFGNRQGWIEDST